MGDIADDCFDRAMEEIADLDYDGPAPFARNAYGPRVTCKYCGAHNVY